MLEIIIFICRHSGAFYENAHMYVQVIDNDHILKTANKYKIITIWLNLNVL